MRESRQGRQGRGDILPAMGASSPRGHTTVHTGIQETELLTDRALVAKKLAWIESCVVELRTLARPEELRRDVRQQGFVKRTLQIAIQAALDVATHIISDQKLNEPEENRGAFAVVADAGWLPAHLADTLSRMDGFRNMLIYQDDEVDLATVEEVLLYRLDDLLAFTAAIRARIR